MFLCWYVARMFWVLATPCGFRFRRSVCFPRVLVFQLCILSLLSMKIRWKRKIHNINFTQKKNLGRWSGGKLNWTRHILICKDHNSFDGPTNFLYLLDNINFVLDNVLRINLFMWCNMVFCLITWLQNFLYRYKVWIHK